MQGNLYAENTVQTSGSAAGVVGGVIIFVVLIGLLGFMFAAMWRMFTKAGQPGWAALIPVYSTYVEHKIVGRPTWWLLLYLVPLVNIVIAIIVTVDLAKAYGQGVSFAIIGLMLFPLIGLFMLAYGRADYVGPVADKNFRPGVPLAAPPASA